MARDRVHPLKFESPSSGGTELDDFPTALDAQEDYVDARGITFQSGAGSNDEAVGLERDGANLKLWDSTSGPKSLSDLSTSALTLKDEGTPVLNTPHSALNFVGLGVEVTDNGDGSADVSVPGVSGAIDDIIAAIGVRPTNIYPATLVTEPGSKVVAENYAALEIGSGTTAFGWGSLYWSGGTPTSLDFHIKFIMKSAGAGTNIRLALKIKSRATGETVVDPFDFEGFVAVPINFTTFGEIFEGTISVPGSIFADNDAISIALGRDGNNILGVGTNDDSNRAIQIIAAEMEIMS